MAANKTGLEMQALPALFSYQPHGLQVSKKTASPDITLPKNTASKMRPQGLEPWTH